MASLSGTTYWNGPSATSQPGSLSHIRTKLFWVYLLRLILKEYKRQDRSHVTTDGRSVVPSLRPAPPGAHDQICVRWILLPVSPEVPHLTAVWVCPLLKSPSFSVVHISYFPHSHYIHILRRSRPHTRDYTLGYLALSVTTSSSTEQSRSVSEDFILQNRSNSSSEATCWSQGTSL